MLTLKNPNLFRQASYINGQWYTSSQSLTVFNPFNSQPLGTVPNLPQIEVEDAIQTAEIAQKKWAKQTADSRSKILRRWFELVIANQEDLAYLMTLEQGKPLKESRAEITYAANFIEWFAEEAKRTYGETIPHKTPDTRLSVIKQPVGVCAAITPWNFPAAMITRKAAPALAAGCAMIVKPATQTPFSALALAELAEQAGIPAGIFNVVTGDAALIGKILCENPKIRKLSFTGSTRIGSLLIQQSATTLKRLSMELGGNAPFIVFDDANIDQAVTGLIASKYRNAGQTCICANRVYVQQQIYPQFIAKYQQAVAQLKVGNGLDPNTDIAPLIDHNAVKKVLELVKDAVDKGAKCLTEIKQDPQCRLILYPIILTNITQNMRIAHEEIFGPVTAIQLFQSEEEVIEQANNTPFGLAAYFYTENYRRMIRVMENLEYGMVGHNTGLISNEVSPFGGIKQSGFGREGSKYGIEEYLTIKYCCSEI